MLDWLGLHRGFFTLLAILFLCIFWLVTALKPFRRLIEAWKTAKRVPPDITQRGAWALVAGIYCVLVAVQIALAGWHVAVPAQFDYALCFLCAFVFPPLVQWQIKYIARQHARSGGLHKSRRVMHLGAHKM